MSEKKRLVCNKRCCAPALIFFGLLMTILGIVSIMFMDKLYDNILNKRLVMKEGNEAYEAWTGLHPVLPLFNKIYIFNYTNIDEIQKGGKPIVKQLGPYSYRENRVNDVVEMNTDEITYTLDYTYYFDQNTSCKKCFESDKVIVPRLPMAVILNKIRDLNVTKKSSVLKRLAFDSLNLLFRELKITPFIEVTVKQLLWGYPDPIMEVLQKLEKILSIFHVKIPKISPIISMQRNGSDEVKYTGNITIATGAKDINNVLQVLKWRGIKHIPVWKTKFGQMLNGSDGTHVHPNFKKTELMYMFLPDACRSMFLEYEKEIEFYKMKTFHYTTSEKLFASGKDNPDNEAFCLPNKCWPGGLMSVGPCAEGDAPIFMSAPHFYQGDKTLVENIVGLNPQEKLHGLYINIEPVTGLSLEANILFQLNFMVPRVELLTIAENLYADENFYPILYFHTKGGVDEKTAEKLRFGVYTVKIILNVVKYSVFAGGILFILLAAFLIFNTKIKKEYHYTLLKNEPN